MLLDIIARKAATPISRWLVLAILGLPLAGCQTYQRAQDKIATADKEVADHEKNKTPHRRPVIGVVNGYWVSTDEVPESQAMRLPPAFRQKVRIKAVEMPLGWVMSNEFARFGFSSVYSTNVARETRVTVDYSGELRGALQALASASGYRWELRGNEIYWSDVETRTFAIPMTPGASSYTSTIGGSLTSSISGTGTSGAGTTTTTTSSGGSGTATSVQNTTRTASVSIWKDVETQIKSMLSKKGSVFVSESTSTVTVTDYPDRLASIERFVDTITSEMTRQILVQVDVIEVTLGEKSAHGIDWAIVADKVGKYGFTLNVTNSKDIFPSGFTAPTLTYTHKKGSLNGSQAIVKALETQGDVSVRTQPRVITLNNQLATLQIGSEVSFLASSSTTTTTNAGTTQALTPGTVRTGLMMFLLPRAMPKSEVIMQMSLSINSLVQLRTITSGSTTIESPDVTTKNFQQIARLKSGEAIVLAGFRQMTDNYSSAGVTRDIPWLFGSKYAQDNRTDTIVLITPYILDERA